MRGYFFLEVVLTDKFADFKGVGYDGEGGVQSGAGGEEAAIGDEEIGGGVEAAVGIEDGGCGVLAVYEGAALVGAPGEGEEL